ncbi:MAG: DUF1804 family protein [Proteobacteria bacterium]|nr:DUF1804 family protein [Pseudomonadota bacterium]
MAASTQQRFAARGLYVYQRESVDKIARKIHVNTRTVARWKSDARKEGDDWDMARTAHSVSAQGTAAVSAAIMEDFMLLFQATMQGLKEDEKATPMQKAETLSRLSDAYNKTMAAAAKSSPALNKMAVALEVLHDLVEFIKTDAPQHAQALLEIIEPFGVYISKKYG